MALLECKICMREFKNDDSDQTPRLLPCGHTLCEQCIRFIAFGSGFKEIQCPYDRRTTPFNGDMRALPKNFALLNYLDELDQEGQPQRVEQPEVAGNNIARDMFRFIQQPDRNSPVFDDDDDMIDNEFNFYLHHHNNGYIWFRQPSSSLEEAVVYEIDEPIESDDEFLQHCDAELVNAFANFNINN